VAWTMMVNLLESCSCTALCPCVLGPAKPDHDWPWESLGAGGVVSDVVVWTG